METHYYEKDSRPLTVTNFDFDEVDQALRGDQATPEIDRNEVLRAALAVALHPCHAKRAGARLACIFGLLRGVAPSKLCALFPGLSRRHVSEFHEEVAALLAAGEGSEKAGDVDAPPASTKSVHPAQELSE